MQNARLIENGIMGPRIGASHVHSPHKGFLKGPLPKLFKLFLIGS